MFYNFLVLILLLQLSSLEPIFSSEYTRPNKYFINCGSKSNTNSSNGRTFIGDLNPSPSFSTGNSETVEDKNPSPNTPPLYNTARVYKRRDSYELEVQETGTYIVRLHFFPFSSPSINLSDAVFNVSASGFSLLSNFGFKNGSLHVEEFLLSVSEGTFSLYFVPSQDLSFAFVNAIEVFPSPERFVPSSATRVTSSGTNGTFTGLSALVLRTVHRINVGGKKVTPENDTLWRTWIEDDAFILRSKAMSIGEESIHGGNLVYDPTRVMRYIAPDYVYNSARVLRSALNFSKMGWDFRVSEEVSRHLIRLHFCDIVSPAVNIFNFSLSIYGGFIKSIDPYGETRNASPFYFDFVVDSGGSRSINVSIGLEPQNAQNPIAFLNGLEIFEIRNVSGLVPRLRRKNNQQGILIGVVVGSVVPCVIVVGLLIVAFLFYKKRTPKSRTSRFSFGVFVYGGTSSNAKSSERTSGFPSSLNLSLKIPFADIETATQNFDENLLLGAGGFGRVYQGLLKDTKVAVKRGKPRSGQGIKEFQTEIIILSEIRHRRLLSLIGYCNEMSEMILVYEFMEKGTLREHLYGSSFSGGLSWEKRLEICIGAAEGLEYLHTGLSQVVLHHDVKSTNILLDEKFDSKVADFGLSKLGAFDPDDESQFVEGSFGYFDPEYTASLIYTEQSDVYSFGVVLLEVLSARPAISEDNVNLAKWAMDRKKNGTIKEIVDRSLVGEIKESSLRVFVDIAEKCLRERGVDRPCMKDVVYDLNYALMLHRGTTRGEPFDEDTATNLAFPYSFAGLREEETKRKA